MKFKLNTARLLAATYGQPFTPATTAPPQIIAMNLDNSAETQAAMDRVVATWQSGDLPDSSQGLLEARTRLGTELSSVFGGACSVNSAAVAYKPIYDDKGNIIGHDTVGWLFVDNQPVIKEVPDDTGETLGMVACVFLSIGIA